jgi:hypothetical protein
LKTPSVTEIGEFENSRERPQSTILDFKKDMYDFSNDQDHRKSAEFVKDIISFANTIRAESAFVIIGIKELPDKSKECHGSTSNIDDAVLQDKV